MAKLADLRSPALLCVLVFLLRLPFLTGPIQGDDVYYLAGAQHAQIDPWHPQHARYAFEGDMVDMRGHPHPPLNTWILAGLLAATKDVYEGVYHGFYVLFSLVATLSMWSLARRFAPQPLLASLLFAVTPAFVIQGTTLEADVPMLAFWMAGTALFVRAVDGSSYAPLIASACALTLAAMTGFQMLLAVPILAVYVWLHRRTWIPAWVAAAVPLFVIVGWQLYERATGGQLPATVLAGYFQQYGLQRLTAKVKNAASLTVHMGWLLFPIIPLLAFWRMLPRWVLCGIGIAALGLSLVDPSPLFWALWGLGALVIAALCRMLLGAREADTRFLISWILLFFLGALVLFFAGAARYLLPLAAPFAMLIVREWKHRSTWLYAGIGLQLLLSLMLAAVNDQHWRSYRAFIHGLKAQMTERRTWSNAEWGMRFYAEAEGALPLLHSTIVQPGDLVLTSELGAIPLNMGGKRPAPIASQQVRPWLPFRLLGLHARSGYSSNSFGLRAFGISREPADEIRAEMILERQPTLSYVPMNAPEAEQHIVSGIYSLEGNAWRWSGPRAAVLIRNAGRPITLEASFYLPEAAKARHITLLADNDPVAEATYPGPGSYTLRSSPHVFPGKAITVTLAVDQTFQVAGDARHLGLILTGIGAKE